MDKIYFDNAATTQIRPKVIHEMTEVMTHDYGNPSSTHSFGRSAKSLLELSRKSIAKNLNCSSQEIIFTSCGTEANNWILRSAVKDLKVTRIITTKIEHHAVLHTVEMLQKEFGIQVDYVEILADGSVNLTDLVELLSGNQKTLVSLMHVNNEIGNVLDLSRVGQICMENSAYFHSDTVQSVGKTEIDLHNHEIDFIVGSAHKFHGPKGIGFAYVRKNINLQPIFYGGEQEKGLRAGTEAVHQIVGMAKALSITYENLETERNYISELKKHLLSRLEIEIPDFKINGNEDGFYNIVNVLLPFPEEKTAMILFSLDMKGIAVSRGSACQSGSVKPSHVLAEILSSEEAKQPSLRVSFSHYNTIEEVDYLVTVLKGL